MERGGGRESVADLLRHSLIAKGGNEGCWSGCLGRSAAENQTDRRTSTAFYIGLDIKLETIGLNRWPGKVYRLYRMPFARYIASHNLPE